MVRRNRSVRTTRKKRQYGGARTKGVPRKYVPRPSRFPMQAANAAAAALQQVQGIPPEIQNQPGMKQKRRVTEKKLAANQMRRNRSQKFKNRGIKQFPDRVSEYIRRSKAGESNNAIFTQWMKPGAAAAPAIPTAPYINNNNAISELSNYEVNTNEYQRLLQEARDAPNVVENENSNRELMSGKNAAAAALAAVNPGPPGGPVTVPFAGKTAKVRKINQLRGRSTTSKPRGRPRKTPAPAPAVPTTTSAFGQVLQPAKVVPSDSSSSLYNQALHDPTLTYFERQGILREAKAAKNMEEKMAQEHLQQSTGHVEAGKKAATSAKGSAWLQEIKEARNLLNKVLQEHGMKAGITQADARTYASLRRKDPVAAQQFTQTVVTNASRTRDESKWSE